MNVKIDEQKKLEYAASVLMHTMAKAEQPYSVVLEVADQDLEILFIHLLSKDFIEINPKNQYQLTQAGQDWLKKLQQRYQKYLTSFDIFCAVDLETAEFAFESFFKMAESEFHQHVNQERFADLRVAVAEHKNMDPVEIVFLGFFHEERFGSQQQGWQFDLKTGLIWDELMKTVEESIHVKDLSYLAEDGTEISAESVIQDVIEQGEALHKKLTAQGAALDSENSKETQQDPNFKNPIWN